MPLDESLSDFAQAVGQDVSELRSALAEGSPLERAVCAVLAQNELILRALAHVALNQQETLPPAVTAALAPEFFNSMKE